MINNNVGLAFPFRMVNGRLQTVGGRANAIPTVGESDEAAQTSALMIIHTGSQERVLINSFGLGAEKYLFANNPKSILGFLRAALYEQLESYSDRVKPVSVTADFDLEEGNLHIGVTLRHNNSDSESVVKTAIKRG